MKLTIELVPRTSWYENVRKVASEQRWREIRNECYNKAGHKCEICGQTGIEQGYDHNVECHEIFEYDDTKHVQKLKGFIALCPHCHKVKHAGLAQINGEEELVLRKLMEVNNMSEIAAIDYLSESFYIWEQRSVYDWTVDLTYLVEYQDSLGDLLSKMNKFRK